MATDCLVPGFMEASWKGVPFHVESSSDDFGRRGDLYEYPLSEQTGYKDLGRKARRFNVEGYLIGGNQVALTVAMATAAESPEPGMLMHPIYGPQLVACVKLTTSAEYRAKKRLTKLSFDFVEGTASMAPYMIGAAVSALFASGSSAVAASKPQAIWVPTATTDAAARDISDALARQIAPAVDEDSYDAISRLERGDPLTIFHSVEEIVPVARIGAPRAAAPPSTVMLPRPYPTFADVVDPIDDGTATVRRIHADALRRLREFNAYVVDRQEGSPSVQSLVLSTRLAMIRDYALTAAQSTYQTVTAAVADLDFVMAVYDDEERAAADRCDDALVTAIRAARADAASTILAQNVRLPGVTESSADGVWPSVVVAHKLYGDGKRYGDVESYNPQMPPFFIGRAVVAPSA